MADKQSPANLRHLAANAFVDTLSLTVKEMDNAIANSDDGDEHKQSSSLSSGSIGNSINSKETSSSSFQSYDEDCTKSAKAAMKVHDIRQYVHSVVPKDLGGTLMKHSISRAVNDNSVSLLRLTIPKDVETLDFRSTDFWCSRSTVPGHASDLSRKSSPTSVLYHSSRWTVHLHGIEPPDEYDWFSWDRMGKIISMNEACELFSIMKTNTVGLKELMINARRPEYWSCSKEQMPVFAEALLQMKHLTKLILRGLADDFMLQLVGRTATGLKYLDISCSKFVTDKGILNLFFENVKEDSALALYLIPSWIQKNLNTMWPLVHTLEYLDFSWTNVTSLARKMVNLIPGSYMFKRHFAVSENEAFGHHIFVRKTPDLVTIIGTKEKDNKFQAELHSFAGKKGVASFMKFTETHPWKNCYMSTFQYSSNPPAADGNTTANELNDSISLAIITPSKDEKRIHGLVTFWLGNLAELYSIYPINLNQLGAACPKLRILSGTVTDVWRNPGSLLPNLTDGTASVKHCADMFGEPASITSLLNSCPSLKKVRIRIIKKILTDGALIQALSTSMSNNYLEELWIAPGSYKKESSLLSSEVDGKPEHASDSSSSSTIPIPDEGTSSEKFATNSGTLQFHVKSEEDGQSKSDPRIEDLVHLSIKCLRRLMSCCKKLRRIGNLSWWNISDEELEVISNELVESNSGVSLLWDNIIIPGGCQFNNGHLVQL